MQRKSSGGGKEGDMGGRERGRKTKGNNESGFVAIQAATPGLSLPYIRTMNEAFSKR